MPLSKDSEKRRAAAVKRRFRATITSLGFSDGPGGGCVKNIGGHTCRVWLQKFVHQPAFRVAMSFSPVDGREGDWTIEFADRWTYKDSHGGRKYDFGIQRGGDEESIERCLGEIRDFVENVAMVWFEEQARKWPSS